MQLRWMSLFGVCCFACCASPAGAEPAARQAPAANADAAASADAAANPGYLLQPGDVLQIAVWKETDLTADVLVRPDGGISFPLAGELPAAGHTVADLTALLVRRGRKFGPSAVGTAVGEKERG